MDKIDHPMSAVEFWRLVAPVVAEIKCGHTSIWLPKMFKRNTDGNPLIPLTVSGVRTAICMYIGVTPQIIKN